MADIQAKLSDVELDGSAGGGMVTVTLNGKGEVRRVKIDPGPGRSERGRDPRGSPGRGVQRCQGQGRGLRAGGDGQAHRRAKSAGRAQAAVLIADGGARARRSDRAAGEVARARSALGAARGAASDQAARDVAATPCGRAHRRREPGAQVLELRQSRCRRSLLDLRRARARRPPDLRGRGRRRSVGARALGRVSRALPRARRHPVGDRRLRPAGSGDRSAPGAGRRRSRSARSFSRPAPRSTVRPPPTTSRIAWCRPASR